VKEKNSNGKILIMISNLPDFSRIFLNFNNIFEIEKKSMNQKLWNIVIIPGERKLIFPKIQHILV